MGLKDIPVWLKKDVLMDVSLFTKGESLERPRFRRGGKPYTPITKQMPVREQLSLLQAKPVAEKFWLDACFFLPKNVTLNQKTQITSSRL